jgi:hypothetical protein
MLVMPLCFLAVPVTASAGGTHGNPGGAHCHADGTYHSHGANTPGHQHHHGGIVPCSPPPSTENPPPAPQALHCGENDLSKDFPNGLYGHNGEVRVLETVNVPSDLQGKSVSVVLSSHNNESVHPGTSLIVNSVSLSLKFGPDGISSAGGDTKLTVVCAPPPCPAGTMPDTQHANVCIVPGTDCAGKPVLPGSTPSTCPGSQGPPGQPGAPGQCNCPPQTTPKPTCRPVKHGHKVKKCPKAKDVRVLLPAKSNTHGVGKFGGRIKGQKIVSTTLYVSWSGHKGRTLHSKGSYVKTRLNNGWVFTRPGIQGKYTLHWVFRTKNGCKVNVTIKWRNPDPPKGWVVRGGKNVFVGLTAFNRRV